MTTHPTARDPEGKPLRPRMVDELASDPDRYAKAEALGEKVTGSLADAYREAYTLILDGSNDPAHKLVSSILARGLLESSLREAVAEASVSVSEENGPLSTERTA